jgi:hypothetical protein
MKRTIPAPERGVCYPGSEKGPHTIAEEHSFNSLPVEIVEHICTFLGPQDACSTFRTQTRFYYPVRENGAFWQRFFERYYYSPSPKQPGQSWLEACKEQNRMLFNIIAGRCTVETIPLDDKANLFTRDDKGRFIIAYLDGSVKVFDPKTKGSVTLEEPSGAPLFLEKMVYEDGLCALQWNKKISVWNLTTDPKKIFNLERNRDLNVEIELIGGTLLVKNVPFNTASPEAKLSFTFQTFDLKSLKKDILGFKLRPFKATIFNDNFNNKLLAVFKDNFLNPGADGIQVWDFQTKKCELHLPIKLPPDFPRFSSSLEMCYSPERGPLCSSENEAIYQFNLQNLSNSRKFCLWDSPGIPDGFRYRGKDSTLTIPFPIKELSFLFHKFLFQQFLHWGEAYGCAAIRNFLPRVRLEPHANLGTFHQGKLFCFSNNGKAIHCLDFTASREDVLREIVKRLEAPLETSNESSVDSEEVSSIEDEEDSTPVDYALMFLERMPLPVQEAIWGIYGEIEEGKEVDPNRLKEAILGYLSSTYGK